MKTVASRTLATSPGKVWEDLEREGAIVITKDGVPRSIMVPTSDATLLEDVQEIVFARARKAVRAIRAQAARSGTAAIAAAEIDREIKAAPLPPRAAWARFVGLRLASAQMGRRSPFRGGLAHG